MKPHEYLLNLAQLSLTVLNDRGEVSTVYQYKRLEDLLKRISSLQAKV